MAILEGTLSKWTNALKGWQYRWFVLDESAAILSYFTSREKMVKGNRRGCVRLKGAVLGIDDQDPTTFTITVDHKTFHFQARDPEEREKWVRRLEDTIVRHNNRIDNQHGYSAEQVASTLSSFDRKVNEADAYLQLMIEQVAKVQAKMQAIETPPAVDHTAIKDLSTAMVDDIKHSIVLLQIAKNTAHPVTGTLQTFSLCSVAADSIEVPPDVWSEAKEEELKVVAPPVMKVPETSYSSSEGEDDFFDANDEVQATITSATSTTMRTQASDSEAFKTADDELSSNSVSLAEKTAANLQDLEKYDAFYEADDDENISMESHGSVVTHLLSQVKIGMDLTKVVLPTFILERRSLLEMYADYFAHPDLFLAIVDQKTPRDRMVQVVKWYLSSYHAGRKSSVAKKPYNPILGEVFRCHWDIPDAEEESNGSSPPIKDGPVPWCRGNQLVFIAEQVSHHPPISAFYAEHYAKRICFTAHVWTKSKFLGLSIGVHNIGQGIVTLCDMDEEYILTFPNGYGRSILTVPWIELGGSVTITCPKTGYHTDIEFLTKPFYGGKKNRITAEVFAPHEKKPFLSIAGEWNGVMEAKWADGRRAETFIDVNAIPVHKKIVKSIAEQSENESRRIWREVTAGLKMNDIDRATNAKYAIEQRQREEAKVRKEQDGMWRTKHFSAVGDGWLYTNPLSIRLSSASGNQ